MRGSHKSIDQINARDGDGLKLFNDGNEGIFITDGGGVGIGISIKKRLMVVLVHQV